MWPFLIKEKSGPEQVAFDITSRCNLRCVHCFNDSGNEAPLTDMRKDEKLEIARQVGSFHPINVCLCGGEVTCCSFLFDVIDILRPQVGKISMVSNGFLMTAELAQKLYQHGVSTVQISIDGAYPWQHDSFRGVAGSFQRAVQAIKYLKEAKIPDINVSLVPNRLNWHSMDEYMKMCSELGVNAIRMMPFLPSGRAVTVGNRLLLNEEEYLSFQQTIARLQKKYKSIMILQWGDPIDHMRRMPNNAAEGRSCYIMEIKTNGDLTVSTYIPLTAGNCRRHTLQEYWQAGYNKIWGNPEYLYYIDKVRNIYDLENFEPQPYTGEMIELDLLAKGADSK